MSVSQATFMDNRRRVVPFWVPLLFGLLSLSNVIGKPSLAAIVIFFRGPRSR
jgi:hypothetical protein